MYSSTFVAAALLAIAAADVGASISAVQSNVELLDSLVKGWSSADGLPKALIIQESFAPLSEAVLALQSAVPSSVSASEAQTLVGELSSLVGAIQGLLGDLSSKAADFNAVGAGSIVGGDIKALVGPSGQIASSAVSAIPSDADCAVYSSATALVNNLAGAFKSAAGAYSVDAGSFPSVPSCPGGGSGSGSAAASSAAPASSGAAASSAAPASSGAAASSAAASSNGTGPAVATSTLVSTVCPTCTEVAPSNGAAGKAMGLGAAVAGVVAMLL
ncbi:hypothetical protein B9G98_03169 [Wickerhamiella sorbophila]|uniref:Cell wall mannoprotein 1 n=1 Tax=Wickerhamiella sorbophila TaxID=45607 RepID=A0A2T0FKP5_9ASCO|nr:hypothetical protein B9G98_03169 [Wickerhamiella sorbophila]PRT55549.1 hypothetical protein B9G98_03169 [Wickerhamiella sorbophila]